MKILVITDSDLDGAGSALFIKWAFPKATVDVVEITSDKYFESTFRQQKTDKYDKVFITDLTIPESLIDAVDKSNFIIVDHHLSHVEVRDRYKDAKVLIQEETSTVKLLQCCFSKVKLTQPQLDLLMYIDDYDQYALKYKEGLKLCAIFYCHNRPKVEKFCEAFKDGFRPYTEQEKNMIRLHFKKFAEQKESLQFYTGEINGKTWVSFMCEHTPNELAHYALEKYNADICLIIYPKWDAVSFRKRRDCDTPLNRLAEVLCDGGGHAYAAGGKLNDNIMKLTQKFKPC